MTPGQPRSLFSSSLSSALFSEAYSAPGVLRPHWRGLLEALERQGATSLDAARQRGRAMRHQDGATLNPFDDQSRQTTAWELDLIPFPLSAEEWRGIESGLQQRARLLDNILRDVYGPQELLLRGLISAELLYDNPAFLLPCHGVQPEGGRFLTLYAADLYRDPEGRFRVLRDYACRPAGLGYALENRIVISRLFRELYHKTPIRRLAPFFHSFHHSLIEAGDLRESDPGIVLLSPGPDDPLYFEHALLSRYLGYPLVEGQDLTVRNGRMFQKKLAGLDPVEAIVRQIDDYSSDPFALRNQSVDGVAGLLQVCRDHGLQVVNQVGSGFVETPALQCFLPEISRRWQNEELLLESHPGWWCGDPASMALVTPRLSELHLRAACGGNGQALQEQMQEQMRERLQCAPGDYIACEPLQPSLSPVWSGDGAGEESTLLRLFACATAKGWQILPGGLAITSPSVESLWSGRPEQLKSKDIWVLSDEPVEMFSMMGGLTEIPSLKRSTDLPNRVADNLLWLGRYLERAEGLIRLLRAVYQRLSGESRPDEIVDLQFLLRILQTKNCIALPMGADGTPASTVELFKQLNRALYGKEHPESVLFILQQVHQTAWRVRDRLSLDSVRVINQLEDFREFSGVDPLDHLQQALFTLSSFSGFAMDSMTRGMRWLFMDMGRRVERALSQATLIRTALPEICAGASAETLEALLEISDSLMTYRGRYRSSFQLAPVLDLLLSDDSNPKSLAFQFDRLLRHVASLPRQEERRFSSKEERIVLDLQTSIRLFDLSGIDCSEGNVAREALTALLVKIEAELQAFAQQVTARYLTRVPATPHYSFSGNTPL